MTPDPRDSQGDRSLKANAAIAAFPRVASIIIQLAMSPFIVSQIGLEAFGFWALLLATIQIVQIADGGLPYATSVMVATARGRGDVGAMRSAVTVTTAVLTAIGLLIVFVAGILTAFLPSSTYGTLPSDAALAIFATAIAVAFTMITNGLNAGPGGLQRWELNTATLMVGQIAGSVATVVFLICGAGVAGVAIGFSLGTGISAAIGVVQLHRVGLWHPKRSPEDRGTLRNLRGQGVHLQVVALASLVNSQADRFLLLPFTTLAWIGAYDLGARIAFALRAFPVSTLGPVISRVAGVYGHAGFEAVSSYYRRLLTITLQYAVAPLLLMSGAVYAGTLAWLGAESTLSATVAVILTFGTAVNLVTAPGTATGNACGRAQFDRDYCLLMLALKIGLSVGLGIWLGPWGVVCATPAALILSSIWLVRRVHRWTGTRFASVIAADRRTLIATGGAVLVSTTGLVASGAADLQSRPEALGVALGIILVGSIAIVDPRRGIALGRRMMTRRAPPSP